MTNSPVRLAAIPASTESVSQRVRRLQQEARDTAAEHVDELRALMTQLMLCADSVADGGDAYPPGVRALARQVSERLESQSQSIEAIMWRQK
jgi:hypothetical protein